MIYGKIKMHGENICQYTNFTVQNVFLTNMLSGNYDREVKYSYLQLLIQHTCHIQIHFLCFLPFCMSESNSEC